MAFSSDSSFVIPKKGIILYADPDTEPVDFEGFDPLVPATYSGWKLIDTSIENQVKIEYDGGEAEIKGTWWDASKRSVTTPRTTSFTINLVQLDLTAMELAYPGSDFSVMKKMVAIKPDAGSHDRAVQIISIDGDYRMSLYFGKSAVTAGEGPEFDKENFYEVQIRGLAQTDKDGYVMRMFATDFGVPVNSDEIFDQLEDSL
jgi:hypothetical protein